MVLWRPEALQAATQASEELGDFAYVVVEELVDRLIVLIAWPWPEADDQGRLFWPMTKESDYKTAVTTRDLGISGTEGGAVNRLGRMPSISCR